MQAAFLQYTPDYLQVEKNLETVAGLLKGCTADLIVLPEMFASGYFFKSHADALRAAEEIPNGPTTALLQRITKDFGATLVAGVPEREGDRLYNSAVVVSAGDVVGRYRKLHLYYEEKQYFQPGNLGLPVFEVRTRDGQPYRLGVMICFDWYFPEAARTLALGGADVIAHPSNLVRPNCPAAMPIRALENHVYTVTANRCGSEKSGEETLTFIGQSLICAPTGEVLKSASAEETLIGTVAFDPTDTRNRRITAHNDLFEDRRPADYRL